MNETASVPEKARNALLIIEQAQLPCALFLDVDGTLLELAPTPGEVVVPGRILHLLTRVQTVLGGALALVSGRSVRQIDALFTPLRLACAGIHGNERRNAGGRMYFAADALARALDPARGRLAELLAANPGLLLEDKGASLAVHYRARPGLGGMVEAQLGELVAHLEPGFRIQEGALVREIVPAAANKGMAIESFMAEPPFAGRMPVFIGDDATDLDGFAAVERRGGRAISVGERVRAREQLREPAAVVEWLEALAVRDGRLV